MPHKRDELYGKAVRALRERVAHHCSNPRCRASTIGPGGPPDKTASIGKAAHIRAAAPGGPRYDPSMTREARRDFANGIWLCSNCATEVDADESAHPVELLLEWKAKAEAAARAERGKRPPRAEDGAKLLAIALTGAGPGAAPMAITNTHTAVAKALGSLDPRMAVSTAFADGATRLTLRAVEPVDFSMTVPEALGPQWLGGFRELAEHGRAVTLNAEGLEIDGSPLLARLLSDYGGEGATVTFGGQPKDAILKLRLLGPEPANAETFDDIRGRVFAGSKFFTFEGDACGGMLTVTLTAQLVGDAAKQKINIAIDFGRWEGADIRRLPHFAKLDHLTRRLFEGWRMEAALEIEGPSVSRGTTTPAPSSMREQQGALRYWALLREICERLGTGLRFETGHAIDLPAFSVADSVARLLAGGLVLGREALEATPSATITCERGGANIRELVEGEPAPEIFWKWVERGSELVALGQTLTLPDISMRLEGLRARVADTSIDLSAIRDGDLIPMEFDPTERFKCLRQVAIQSE
jgi:hypothetical protein